MNKKLLILHTRILFFLFFICSYSVSFGQTTLFQFNFENGFAPNIENVVGTPEIFQSGVSNAGVRNGNACEGDKSLSGSEWNIGDYYLFIVNTTGYENMTFSYCNSSSNNNIGSFLVLVSSDLGATTSTIVPSYTPTTSNVTTTSIILPASANNNGEVWIAIYKDSNPDGNNRTLYIDNASLRGCPIITAGTLSGNQYTCGYNPSTTQFSSTVSAGTWTSSDTSVATVNSSSGLVTTTTKGGSATITYTVGSGSCAKIATRMVYVAKAPSAAPTFTGASSTLQCQNSTATYTINALTGASGYIWATSATGWTIVPSSDGLSAVITFGANAVNGNFSVKASNGCDPSGASGSAVTSVFIFISQPSFGGSIPATASGCAGDYIINLGLTGQIGNPIRWESSVDNFLTTPTIIAITANNINVSNLSQTTYYRAVVQNSPCSNIAYSNVSTITINPKGPASVSIAASSNPICSGTPITFTATPTNGGAAPSFQWKLNGANVGTNSSTYTTATLANGNTITCVMTSNSSCATGSPATSNTVTAVVNIGISAPTLGTRTQPTCSTVTGSAVLNGLPIGSWELTRNPGNVLTTGSGTSTTISGLSSGTYTYSVIGTNNGTGLKGEYFNNRSLSGTPALTRTDATVNFDWVNGNPGTPITNDNFSVKWSGQIQPLYSENYIFTTKSDDGIRLWINGIQIINNWTDHAVTSNISSPIALIAGVKYDVILEYYENGGQAVSQLSWSSARQTLGFIQQSQLYPVASCSSPASADVVIDAQPATPKMPTAGATTQPDCITATGSVSLSGLPTGSWTLNRRIKGETVSVPISANTTEYEDKGLAVGIYFYTVTQGSCISLESQQVSINNAPTPVTNTWNGTSWSLNTPTSLQSLIFDSPSTTTFTTPFLTDISGCSCLVKSGANIIFSAGKTLKILNEVAVEENGILTFENNASLVQTNDAAVNTGNISYNRMTSAVRSSDFTYWSSPVLGQTFLKAFPAAGSGRLYSFGAAVNNWEGKSASSAMLVGTGYIVQVPVGSASVPYVATFVGVPNNGLIDKTPIGPTNSFNLIGNPYPSALDADAFLYKNAAILNGTIYFWTHNTAIQLASGITNGSAGSGAYAYTSDDYATYNGVGGLATTAESKASILSGTGNRNIPTGRIAAGQAFFVSSKKTGTIIFNNAMRLGADKAKLDNSQFFKINTISKLAQTIEKNRIWLNLTNTQGAFKQTLVGYVTGATNEYDSRFDGESFNANAYVNFYSINLNRNWSIQGRALPFDSSDQVPLGYSSNVAGDFTINIAQLDGFLTAQSVFLEDKLTNTVFDLKSGDYTFTTAIGVFNDRFVLRYTNKTLGTEDFKSLENEVLVSNTDRLIQINSTIETLGKVVIYDIAGKQLYMKTNLDAKELQIANLAASHQVLLVNISLQNGQVFTKKIIF